MIAQLFRLPHNANPRKLGVPLASVSICAAVIVLVLGFYRFWRQQNAILRGKVHAGGFELRVIMIVYLLVSYRDPVVSKPFDNEIDHNHGSGLNRGS